MRDSIQTLAKYSKEFDTAISGIRNAFKELGANISVAMSGALNAIAPIVTQIINWLSKIITYVSAFIAMLSGKNTVIVAKSRTKATRNRWIKRLRRQTKRGLHWRDLMK